MSPQFVDLDGDGRLDIVAGIYDGSPHVAFGTEQGWKEPEQILDREGARIVMNQFWDYDTKKWAETKRCDPDGRDLPHGHLTSAWAADIDGDGDLDLLLGDHEGGQVLLRRNEGSREQAAFATRNEVVLCAGEPLVVTGTVATLRLVDWDGDGAQDLLVGSMGDSYQDGPGGGVFVYRNTGTDAAPAYAKPVALIEPGKKGAKEPTRPDAGLYMDAGDIDGDGDLDLVVGGYSMWTPDAPVLDEAQQARVAAMQQEVAAIGQRQQAFYAELDQATSGLEEAAADQKRKELLQQKSAELQAWSRRRAELVRELDPLVPGLKRQSFVWLYENLARGQGGSGGER